MALNYHYFLVILQLTLNHIQNRLMMGFFKLIVGGDFNATIGKDCSPEQWECVGKNHDLDLTNSNGTRLLNFSKELNLFVMNSFYGYKDIHRWSFFLILVTRDVLTIGFAKNLSNVL